MSMVSSREREFLSTIGLDLIDSIYGNHVNGYYKYVSSGVSLPLQYEVGINNVLSLKKDEGRIYGLLSYVSRSIGTVVFWIDPSSKFFVCGLSEIVKWDCSYNSKKRVFALLDNGLELQNLIEQNNTLYPITVIEKPDFTVLSTEIEKVYLNSVTKKYVVGLIGSRDTNYSLASALLEYLRTAFQTRTFPV